MAKLKCWRRENGTYGWERKDNPNKYVSIMKAPDDKRASLVINDKETTPKTIKQALKIANKYMKSHDKC